MAISRQTWYWRSSEFSILIKRQPGDSFSSSQEGPGIPHRAELEFRRHILILSRPVGQAFKPVSLWGLFVFKLKFLFAPTGTFVS